MWQDMGVSVTIQPEGLRERKKARTHEALERAALDLFARQGFEHTTIEDIADACEVSPRTFFRYFSSKADVLFGGNLEERRCQMLALLEAQPATSSPLAALRAALLTIACEYEEDRDRLATRMAIIEATPSLRASKSEQQRGWDDAVVELLGARAGRSGTSAGTLELRLVAAAGTAAFRAALEAWLAGPKSQSLTALVNAAFDRLAAGLDPPDPQAATGRQ
jgi:AcrR family transcriptional regulator